MLRFALNVSQHMKFKFLFIPSPCAFHTPSSTESRTAFLLSAFYFAFFIFCVHRWPFYSLWHLMALRMHLAIIKTHQKNIAASFRFHLNWMECERNDTKHEILSTSSICSKTSDDLQKKIR